MHKQYFDYCMKFSNKELQEYLVNDIILNFPSVQDHIRYLDENDDDIRYGTNKTIETIVFDGDKETLFIHFFNAHTSICVFDKEIMFIDESAINTYTSSDVEGNVVYEGNLREMTHAEILNMFSKIICCFVNAIDIKVITQKDSNLTGHKYFSAFKYILNVNNHKIEKDRYEIGNIIINY